MRLIRVGGICLVLVAISMPATSEWIPTGVDRETTLQLGMSSEDLPYEIKPEGLEFIQGTGSGLWAVHFHIRSLDRRSRNTPVSVGFLSRTSDGKAREYRSRNFSPVNAGEDRHISFGLPSRYLDDGETLELLLPRLPDSTEAPEESCGVFCLNCIKWADIVCHGNVESVTCDWGQNQLCSFTCA